MGGRVEKNIFCRYFIDLYIFYMSAIGESVFKSFLWTGRSITSILWIYELLQNFCRWRNFYKTSMFRRPPIRLLWIEEHLQAFYGWKILYRPTMYRRPCTSSCINGRIFTGLLGIQEPLQVFCAWKSYNRSCIF